MGNKNFEKNGARRRGRTGRSSTRRAEANKDGMRNRTTAAGQGSSRLLLTRLLRDGLIWNVFIATSATAGAPNVVRLEFERSGPGHDDVRYTRPVEGPLLDALHSGGSLSRVDLEHELELAIREGAGDADKPPTRA